jgi:hypothetical protein
MLRLVADENFNGAIVRGLLRAAPDLDIVTIQDIGLAGASDAEVLEWAASAGRLLLTHDVRTMPGFVRERVESGRPMPGASKWPGRTRLVGRSRKSS